MRGGPQVDRESTGNRAPSRRTANLRCQRKTLARWSRCAPEASGTRAFTGTISRHAENRLWLGGSKGGAAGSGRRGGVGGAQLSSSEPQKANHAQLTVRAGYGWGASGGAAAAPPGASRLIASAGTEPRRDCNKGHAGGA